jgi:hypothetical protein
VSDQTEVKTPDHQAPPSVVAQIPLAERKRNAWIIVGAAAGLCLLVWAIQYSHDQLREYWWFVWPVAAGGILWAFITRFNATKTIAMEAGKAAQLRKQSEAQRRESELLNKWWVRYPLAVLTICGAVWIWSEKPNLSWVALGALIYALWLAREAVGVALVAGGAYLLFIGVAALPVNAAVIVGAIIIASAVGKK